LLKEYSTWKMYFMFTGKYDCRTDWNRKDTGKPFESGMQVVNNNSEN
jgi:hypothetical protein